MIKFSVVIPIYDEEGSVEPLYLSLKSVMDRMKEPYEIIFVNDCSRDGSLQALKNIDAAPAHLTIVSLRRHSGQSAALQAGFDAARGETIITIDGDLQNDPGDIPCLLDKIKSGYDVVCGWRYDRKDPWHKIAASRIANLVCRIAAREKIHDTGCTLRVFKRSVLKDVRLSENMHRFFTLIMARRGYSIGEVKVSHSRRKSGKSKYGILNRLGWVTDLIRIAGSDMDDLMRQGNGYEIEEIIRRR
ncbi:MAG: glycosyltransferase family 2 protein [Candidatus Omnitrophota bacterium]